MILCLFVSNFNLEQADQTALSVTRIFCKFSRLLSVKLLTT